jgi:hypothetical protein
MEDGKYVCWSEFFWWGIAVLNDLTSRKKGDGDLVGRSPRYEPQNRIMQGIAVQRSNNKEATTRVKGHNAR